MAAQHVVPPATQPHPALLAARLQRAQSLQLRIADDITKFAGSMAFVYLHVALFAVWMLILECSPWPTLTLAGQSVRGPPTGPIPTPARDQSARR